VEARQREPGIVGVVESLRSAAAQTISDNLLFLITFVTSITPEA
jgi:hypothetical protein